MKRTLVCLSVAALLGGCMTSLEPSLSRRGAVAVAKREATARFPGADLSHPDARNLGDRWSVTYPQPATAAGVAGGAKVVVIQKRGRKVVQSFDMH